jgi:hypothetical protein
MKNLFKIIGLLSEYFHGDEDKVCLWLRTPNPLLGGMPPVQLIESDRTEKLLKFIESCKEGEFP